MKYQSALFFLAALPIFMISSTGFSSVPSSISIQGILENSSGEALSGLRAHQIRFYDAQTGGSPLGSAINGSALISPSGRFTIEITPPSEILDQANVWYEVGIDSAASPDGTVDVPADVFPDRVKVNSVPFALQADNAQQWLSGNGEPDTLLGKLGDEYYDADSGDIYKKNGAEWLLTSAPASLNQGSVFTRWGNANAPAGTELIYSGLVYGSYGAHSDGIDPFVMHPLDEDPGSLLRSNNPASVVYPMVLFQGSGNETPLNITYSAYVQGAVCFVNAPITIIWGTHNAPAGWEEIYKGYSFGNHHQNRAGGNQILIDIDDFDASILRSNNIVAPYYAMTSWEVPSGNQRIQGYIKGILVKKSTSTQ